jgi:hypothetical protein
MRLHAFGSDLRIVAKDWGAFYQSANSISTGPGMGRIYPACAELFWSTWIGSLQNLRGWKPYQLQTIDELL